jgi:hypothetical protein
MADTGEIFSDVSFEVDTYSARPSAIETEADVGSVAKLSSSIHKHCRLATKEEKKRTKKTYFCKYCPPQDSKGYCSSTVGLQGHLRKHDIEWSTEENNRRTTARDLGEKSIQDLYEKLLAKGEVQGLEGEVLKHIVEQSTVKQALLDLIMCQMARASCPS